MGVKKELQAYYAKQGLTGKHLRKAIQYDMKAVKAAAKAQRLHAVPDLMAFHWGRTPQSKARYLYWAQRNACTGK